MLTWNISAQASLSKTENTLLKGIMDRETASWNNFLFNILSIAYDKSSLDKIRANLESGTVGSVNYALEMIDIVIGDAIKPRLVSLVDVVGDEEKLRNLHQFYPGEIPEFNRLIDDIINRDYNLLSVWSKASALHSIDTVIDKDLVESITALLFSPEKILREEAARLIGRSDKNIFTTVSSRIPRENLPLLEMIVNGTLNDKDFLFEKTSLLTTIFTEIPEDELLFLAENMIYGNDLSSFQISGDDEYLLWLEDQSDANGRTMILNRGIFENSGARLRSNHSAYYLLNLNILEEFQSIFPDQSFDLYKHIDKLETYTK
jgi:hypothetical protein